jgi:dihydropteroate synthase
MAPKAITHIVRVNSLSNITANILKQEMLSLGGEVAVCRGALTGRVKKTDCLIMGNLVQFQRLNQKLHRQPFGLTNLASDLSLILSNYQKDKFELKLGRYKISLRTGHARLMGIINLTPDSFSGDGVYGRPLSEVIKLVESMLEDGADIIDIGGESSRPNAKPITSKEEIKRTIPLIKEINRRFKVPVSIDTYKPEVARLALENGAVIVNDITGLRHQEMAETIARYDAGVIIMHMKGSSPRTMQDNPQYGSLLDEIIEYLGRAIQRAVNAGIDKGKIIIDPGLGFGKTIEHNLEILRRLKEFKVLGRPLLIGPSRKSFIGSILKTSPQERISGTLSACVLAVENGASIVRVHDVKAVRQALQVLEAIDNL